jgi:hypothetical protein
MKIYLDSEDSFYSIKHEVKKPNKKDNDKTIRIISLVLMVAYVAYLIVLWYLK